MEAKRVHDDVTLVKAIKLMFQDIKSGKTIYLAFSRKSFHIMIFSIATGIIANVVLFDLLLNAPTFIQRTNMSLVQLSISFTAVIAGLWLFFKGINMIVE